MFYMNRILQELLDRHKGKTIGIVLGLAFGWFAVTYSFFKAVFVVICIIAGYYVGKKLDEQMDFRDILDRLFRGRF